MNFDTKITVTGDEEFRVYASSFWIPALAGTVTLKYSGDGVDWLDWDTQITANTPVYVKGFDSGLHFKLSGNTATVQISY